MCNDQSLINYSNCGLISILKLRNVITVGKKMLT